MKYLFTARNELGRVLGKKNIFLFLDYDGTLAPIADKPGKAFLPKETKKLLTSLVEVPNCKIAIISGRSLKDVKNKVGIKNIIYAGNHGLEVEGSKIKLKKQINQESLVILKSIKAELAKKLSEIQGVFVEDKGLTLSLHYRLADKKYIPEVKAIFHKIIISHLANDRIRIKSGKMVFEVRPSINWDKGKIVLWLLARERLANKNNNILPVYVGDDVTDEDAFRVLRNKGITVFVGLSKKSSAEYYLKSTQEVTKLLEKILEHHNKSKQCMN